MCRLSVKSLIFLIINWNIEKLKKALEKKTDQSWKIVVRLHPRMQNSLEKVCIDEKKQIVKADAYPDIQELLAAAQVVITDYSSCIFDFLLTVRPGFLFVPDLEHYDQERGFYYKLEELLFQSHIQMKNLFII